MKLCVFIVDDDPDYARLLHLRLNKRTDVEVHTFGSGEEAIAHLGAGPDLVLLDVMMPGIGGLETLQRLKAHHPGLPVVMVSAQSVVRVALEAIQLGARDYLIKGQDDFVKLDAVIDQAAERLRLVREVEQLRGHLRTPQGVPQLVGESKAMARVYAMIRKALRGDLTVAILGESGTGKELVAEAIHYNSSRKAEPFVVVNCAAIPRDLMESTFFGHEKGAFTGAHARAPGRFEQADGGTLFLDEIGELNLDLQAKLLRVLQNQQVQRVGGTKVLRVDVRVVAATNRDIGAMVRDGRFREDLYYRLFQFPIQLPPLREREQDVLLLADHFLQAFIRTHPEFRSRTLGAAARRALVRYRWPGNVRELKSAVERSVLIADQPEIQPEDLMLGDALLQVQGGMAASKRPPGQTTGKLPAEPRRDAALREEDIVPFEELKRQALEQAYRLCEGNIERTAFRLGITRSTVYRLLKKYAIGGDGSG